MTMEAGTSPWKAPLRSVSPSRSHRLPNCAPQTCTAFASTASNTGPSSPDEVEMTCSTSEVAVCCCNDSRSSLSSRVFSIAMTAWSANVFSNSICFSENGCTARRLITITPMSVPSRDRGTPRTVR